MHRRRARALLASLPLIAVIVAAALPAHAATQGDLARSRSRAAATRKAQAAAQSQADRLLAETRSLQAAIDRAQGRVDDISSQVDAATALRSRIDSDTARLRAEIAVKTRESTRAKVSCDTETALLAARISAVYRQGDMFYVELLLGSRSVTDLLNRTAFVQQVILSNQRITKDLRIRRAELENARIALERATQALAARRAEQVTEENRLRTLQSGRADALRDQETAQSAKRSLLAETKANVARLRAAADAEEAEAAQIAADLRGDGSSRGHGKLAGTMTWPTPGHTEISSGYGWRMHPILHKRLFHRGVDIAAPHGARIVAAASGTVIFAGDRGGYGNVTMIDHGDGLVTVYAHQSSIGVSEGQRVRGGQAIGRVGSTGNSTGPHLHFEVRVNGSTVNPLNYL